MIYCPHCRKPSARTSGPCPHCGNDLSQKKAGPATGAPETGERPRAPAQLAPRKAPVESAASPALAPPIGIIPLESDGFASESGLELGDGASVYPRTGASGPGASRETAMSGLALKSLEPGPTLAEEVLPNLGMDDYSVKQAAGYGNPGDGIVGAVRYWIKVVQRRKELRVEIEKAEEESRKQTEIKLGLQAELGRKASDLGVKTGAVGELISKALLAQAELKGLEKKRLKLSDEHKTKTESLGAAIEIIEKKIAPSKSVEREILEQKQKLVVDRKGVETRLKRFQIDLRNMDELIRKRQEAYSDLNKPKEERAALLKDISTFDRRRPGLTAQVEALETEMHSFDAPLADVEYRLREVREQMAPDVSKIMALTHQIDDLTRKFASDDEQTATELGAGRKAVLEAWALAGERIIKEKLDEPELEDLKKRAHAAMGVAASAEGRFDVLKRAIDSYDGDVVKKAKIVTAAVGIGLILVLFILTIIF